MKFNFKKNKSKRFIHQFILARKKQSEIVLREDEEAELMHQFDEYIAEGQTNKAILTIKEILIRSPSSIPLNILLHGLLVQTERWSMLAQHTRTFLPLLIKMQEYDMAADVYIAAHRSNKDCKPSDPDCYHYLANELRKKKHPKTAVNLLKDFHIKFKDNPDTAQNYLLVAQIYAEDLQDQVSAKKILNFIHKNWPTSKWGEQAKKYYNFVNEMVHCQLVRCST